MNRCKYCGFSGTNDEMLRHAGEECWDRVCNEAEAMLVELEEYYLDVVLIPAPDPMFEGHMIRKAVNRNPRWYRNIFSALGYVNKEKVKKTLEKISQHKKVCNVYVDFLLKEIENRKELIWQR